MTNTCDVCCEKYNKQTHVKFTCPSCNFDCCRECIRKYHMNINEDPHCMKCKNRWSRDILIDATLKSFVDNKYKKHVKQNLLEQQKSKLPEIMPEVENHLECKKLKTDMVEIKKKQKELREELKKLRRQDIKISTELYLREKGKHKELKKEFIKNCPAEGCRGFLSKQWKCGVCNKYTCPKCFVVKESGEETKNPDHVCKKEDLESANLIRKECKDCPGCGTSIFKTQGCDQMWCTQCHVAFSWNTGRRVTGVIHNPHFYAWQKSNNDTQINVPGAVMCGGLPHISHFTRFVTNGLGISNLYRRICISKVDGKENVRLCDDILNMHQRISHFSNIELNYVRRESNNNNNNDLGIKFILNEIDEDKMASELMKRKKKYDKNRAVLDIYEIVNTVFTESMQDIYQTFIALHDSSGNISFEDKFYRNQDACKQCILKNIQRCEKIRKYANNELVKVSITYSQHVNIINKFYNVKSFKFRKTLHESFNIDDY